MAANNARSRLLELPRELRNNIYEEVTHDTIICITKTADRRKNELWLDNAPLASVMRVCKQIHDEYHDVRFKNAELVIYAKELKLKLSSFNLRPGVPKSLFKHVTWCQITISYGLLTDYDPELRDEFVEDVLDGESVEETFSRDWTPSMHATHELSVILEQLAKWIPEKKASIGIEIFMNRGVHMFEEFAEQRLIQAPTFSDFRYDEDTPFTRLSKVNLRFSIKTELFSRIIAWDTTEELGDRIEYEPQDDVAGTVYKSYDSDGIEYEVQDSKDFVRWFLLPLCRCHGHNGWCGFAPYFGGISRCCHQH